MLITIQLQGPVQLAVHMLWPICTNLPNCGEARWDLPKYEPSLLHGITMKGLNCSIACFCFYKMSQSSAQIFFYSYQGLLIQEEQQAYLFMQISAHETITFIISQNFFHVDFRLACSNWVLWKGVMYTICIYHIKQNICIQGIVSFKTH